MSISVISVGVWTGLFVNGFVNGLFDVLPKRGGAGAFPVFSSNPKVNDGVDCQLRVGSEGRNGLLF